VPLGKDLQINQVRYEYLFFMTEAMRISVYTPELTSVASGFDLHTAMIPVGAINRRTIRMVGRLT
jgi:biotin carboxylase